MISEFLSSDSWMNPQINYLLFLQDLRIQTGGVFDSIFMSLTRLGELLFPTLFMGVIYWCVDFRAGLYLFMVNAFTLAFAQLFKMMACIYRPWVISSSIQPPEVAIKTAGGYSFPSGHSMMASSVWGAMAFVTRNKKALCTFFILLVLIVAFSRNWLGVHTPQDVIIGILTGAVMIFVVNSLIQWCEKNKNRYLYLLVISNIIILGFLYYILVKDYPMDYINGKLLVNPRKAINISVSFIGWLLGTLDGVILTRRFAPFEPKDGSLTTKIIRALVGIITVCCMFYCLEKFVFVDNIAYRIKLPLTFLAGFYVTAIYPLIFSKVFKK